MSTSPLRLWRARDIIADMDDIARQANPADGASGRFLLRIEPGLHAVLRRAAAAAGLSLNDYCARKLAAPGPAPWEPARLAVTRAAAQVGEGLVGVAAFGSWARGEDTTGSDVDMLIVVDASVAVTRALYRIWDDDPLRWNGRRIEPHFVGLPEAGSRPTGLWLEVAVDGVVLFERGFELSGYLATLRRQIAAGAVQRRWTHGQPYWIEVA